MYRTPLSSERKILLYKIKRSNVCYYYYLPYLFSQMMVWGRLFAVVTFLASFEF